MSYQTAKTIKSVVEEIDNKKYLLPSIQREFVWTANQIERLFDSLLNDYPINSFLFWKVKGENVNQYEFYKFLEEYHELTSKHNKKFSTDGKEEIVAVLDGQQRLTSLYIALKGSYAYKMPRMRCGNPLAYPKRKLHVNLLSKSTKTDMTYDFKFLTDEEAAIKNENTLWFRVGEILKYTDTFELNDYVMDNAPTNDRSKLKFATKILTKLFRVIAEKGTVSYYLEETQELDKVLNIFIRINSGGSVLSYSDLLLSIATAQWEKHDAREEIIEFVDNLNYIGDGFNFNKDFVLKASLVLSGIKEIAFKVDNFNKENMLKIENEWDKIKEAIQLAVEVVASFGYSRETLTSNNAIIPIAYYIKHNNFDITFVNASRYKADRENIRKWLIRTLLKKVFGGQPDEQLRKIRNIIDMSRDDFPIDEIVKTFKGTNKSIIFDDEDIENLLWYQYGNPFTFSILQVLYPTFDFKNKFHVDHIHPKSLFTKSKLNKLNVDENLIEKYMSLVNYIGNLQLLDGQHNIEKSNKFFKEWIKETFNTEDSIKEYMNKHYIPDIDLDITNFNEFIEKRESLIKNKLANILM